MELVKQQRQRVKDKPKRLGNAFVDGVYEEAEYQRQRCQLELEMESQVVPEADAAEEVPAMPRNMWKSRNGWTAAWWCATKVE